MDDLLRRGDNKKTKGNEILLLGQRERGQGGAEKKPVTDMEMNEQHQERKVRRREQPRWRGGLYQSK